jgi:hypothetical protein
LFPVFIVLLSIPLCGERLNLVKGLSILFAFIGMLLIVSNGHLAGIRLSNLGWDSLALAAALSWALFSVIGKKNQAEQDLAIYLYTIGAFSVRDRYFSFSSMAIPDAASRNGGMACSEQYRIRQFALVPGAQDVFFFAGRRYLLFKLFRDLPVYCAAARRTNESGTDVRISG